MHLEKKLNTITHKKILALDGGGIRGLISIEILAKIEQELRIRENNPSLVLSDYFDFVAGTSTGALIGAAISIGMCMDEIRAFYVDGGEEMFERAGLWNQYKNGYKFYANNLRKMLQKTFDADTTLGSEKIKTLLLIIMHNTKTDSPWPISNNPYAKYNNLEKKREKSNLHLPLWQLLRASTAAPSYFEPEHIEVAGNTFSFVDGAVTPYNNPAFQAYLMATLNAYNLNWQKGEKNLLLVSVGTGESSLICNQEYVQGKSIISHAQDAPKYLINAISTQQDMLCRVFGRCKVGYELDGELGHLQDALGTGCIDENLFTYLRYNVKLTQDTLKALGVGHLDAEKLGELDEVKNIDGLQELGKVVAEDLVDVGDFEGF